MMMMMMMIVIIIYSIFFFGRLENVSNMGTGSVSPWLVAALRGGFSEQAKQVVLDVTGRDVT